MTQAALKGKETKRIGASRATKLVAVAAAAGLLTACQNAGDGEVAGTLIGAGLGALIAGGLTSGHGEGAAIAFGTVAGGLIGNSIGRNIDETNRLKMERVRYETLERGRSYEDGGWYDPDTGDAIRVRPQPAYQSRDGRYCREFQQTITVGGREETGYGTACRNPDGSWEIVS